MNERYVGRAGPFASAAHDAAVPKQPMGDPTVASVLNQTNGQLTRALEVAETLLSQVRGPSPTDGAKGIAVAPGILNDAGINHDLARVLCDRLDELARLLG